MVRIGVYDSGVGGLSVTHSLQKLLTEPHYFYLCDNLNFPYGTKSDEAVISITTKNCVNFIDRYDLDVLVIACNTASTVALQGVRTVVKVPVVGVVPAIKLAAPLSKSKSIGLLATPGTVKRTYTLKLIEDFASDCNVSLQGSSILVELAERKLRGLSILDSEIRSELDPLFAKDPYIDVVVLGCTHFPLLQVELRRLYPIIQWVDSGAAIAARVKSILPLVDPKQTSRKDSGVAVFTADSNTAHTLSGALVPFGFTLSEYLKF